MWSVLSGGLPASPSSWRSEGHDERIPTASFCHLLQPRWRESVPPCDDGVNFLASWTRGGPLRGWFSPKYNSILFNSATQPLRLWSEASGRRVPRSFHAVKWERKCQKKSRDEVISDLKKEKKIWLFTPTLCKRETGRWINCVYLTLNDATHVCQHLRDPKFSQHDGHGGAK